MEKNNDFSHLDEESLLFLKAHIKGYSLNKRCYNIINPPELNQINGFKLFKLIPKQKDWRFK